MGEKATETKPLNVYQAIAKVQADLAKEGIGKQKRNKEQGYQYRGIDDVYNSLSHILSDVGLCILPRILSRDLKERLSKNGTPLFNVVVEAEFDLVSAADGSSHVVRTYGEAMDSADKATNKAMSAAYKNMAFMAFCVPTEGDNDADATTHEVKSDTIFATAQDRKSFIDERMAEIGKATTVEELADKFDLSKAKLLAMKGSKDAADVSAYKMFADNYNAKVRSLKAGQQPQAVAATVDAVVQGNKTAAATLADDEIPF